MAANLCEYRGGRQCHAVHSLEDMSLALGIKNQDCDRRIQEFIALQVAEGRAIYDRFYPQPLDAA